MCHGVLPALPAAIQLVCVLQIGLCIDGSPELGVVVQPATGIRWKAVCGERPQAWRRGADGVETPMDVLPPQTSTFRFANSKPIHPGFKALVRRIVHPRAEAVEKGSAGLKAMLVAEGHADVYTSSFKKISVWDVCAGHAIVKAVGGELFTLEGTRVDYSKCKLTEGTFFCNNATRVDLEIRGKVQSMYEYIANVYSQ